MTSVLPGTCHVTTKRCCLAPFCWILIKRALKETGGGKKKEERIQSLIQNHMQHECCEPVQEQRIAIYKSKQAINNNNNKMQCVAAGEGCGG